FWYPQGQVAHHATAELRLMVPSEYQVVASGALTGTSVIQAPDPRNPRGDVKYARRLEFVADRPVPYLSCLISRFVPAGSLRVDVPAIAPAVDAAGANPPAAIVNVEVVSTPRQANQNRQLGSRVA